MNTVRFSKVKVLVGVVVGISFVLSFSVIAAQYNPGCKLRGSSQARFLWVTQENPGPSVTLTSGPCGVGGDSAKGYIFMFSNDHRATCSGSTPCSGYDWGCCEYPAADKTVAVIKVTGNQKAFQDIFSAGISFSGDYCWYDNNTCYCSSVNVTETGKEYVLQVAGGDKSAIVVGASITKCDLKYANSHFGISVTFYEGRGSSQPGSSDCMSQMASTNGSIKVAINQRTGTTTQNFVPDARSGSNIASIKSVTHNYNGGKFSATVRRQNQSNGCSPVTVALGAYSICSFSIPQSETYYLVKVPGWERAVVVNQGLPGYMVREGWEYSASGNYVFQNRGDLGKTVYHLDQQGALGHSLSRIEYCQENVQPGSGQDQWQVAYTGDQIASIQNMIDPNNPSTYNKKYVYTWGTAANDNPTVSVAFTRIDNEEDERQWEVEFDKENRPIRYSSGCQTGCSGGNGEYQHIEYYDPEQDFGIDPNHPDYSSFQDLIKARYGQYDDPNLVTEEFVYDDILFGEYVPGYSMWIDNPSFAFPSVPESTCQQLQSNNIGWEVDTYTNVQICNDPNNSMDGTDHQYLKINSEATLTQDLEWIADNTRYTLKARFRSVDEQNGSATIQLLSTNQTIENPLLILLESENADPNGWMEGSWESMNYGGKFYNWDTDRLSIQINGTNAEIDCIELRTEAYIEHKIPQIVEYKARPNSSGELETILKRHFDVPNKTVTEHRKVGGNFRVTQYEFEDSSFKTWIKKTEYQNLANGENTLPSGDSFLTTNDPNYITGYVITYPRVNGQGNPLRKDVELHTPDEGNPTEYRWKDFYTLDVPNQIQVAHTRTLERLFNQWEVVEQTNAYGATTRYEYEHDSVSDRYRLKNTYHPVTSQGSLVTILTYDDAQRVIQELHRTEVGQQITPLRVRTYQYNAETGFLDSTTDTHDGISATTKFIYNPFGQLIRQINPDDVATGKFYGQGGELLSEFVISGSSDPNTIAVGGLYLISQTKFVYDDQGRIEEIHKAKDNGEFLYDQPDGWIKTKFVFDGQGRKIQQIEDYDNTNLTTYYQYNLQGELELVTYTTGRWVITIRDGRGLVQEEQVGYGQTVVYETVNQYDDNGNLFHQTNPDDTELYFIYDNVDRLQEVTRHTQSGPSTVKEYNSTGTVKRQYALDDAQQILTDSLFWYDTLGRVTMEIAQADPEQTNDPNFVDAMEDRVILNRYNLAGNLYQTIQKAPGNTSLTAIETGDVVLTHEFDGMGKKTQTLNSEGIIRRFQYTQAGQLWKTIDPVTSDPNLLFETETLYDLAGRLWKTITAEGDYTESEYNSLHQLIRQTVYDCDDTPESPEDDYGVRQIRYAYDNLGNQILKAVMRDPASNAEVQPWEDWITESVYDEDTNLLYQQIQYYEDEGTAFTSYFYDDIGRQIRVVDPEGNEEIIYYDPDNGVQIITREQIETCPDDPSKDYTITTSFAYDEYGRKTLETLERQEDPNLVTGFLYDDLDQIETVTSPAGIVTLYEYNAFGQRFRTTEDVGGNSFNMNRETESVYDRLGRQVEVIAYDPDESVPEVTLYQFDTANRLEKITYPDDKHVSYTYGWLDKVQNELRRDGTRIYYGYDRVGNLLWESDICLTDPNFIGIDPEYETGFEYDAAGQLTGCSKWDTNGLVAESTFVYNGFGLAESEETVYFDLDPVTTLWTYDGSGNLTTQTHNDTTLTYTHDGLGRILTIDRDELGIAEYAYIGRNTHTLSYPDADVTEQYGYDDLGRLNGIGSGTTSDTLLDLIYTYDENSNRDSVKYNHLTNPVWDIYSYDRLQRLIQAEYSSPTGLAMLEDLSGDILFAASVGTSWMSSDGSFMDLARARLQVIRHRQKQVQTALAKSGLDRVIRKYNDGQMPVVSLVEFGEAEISDTKSTSTYEMVRGDDGKLIAIVVMDEAGRITLFTLYPDVGGTVIVRSSYDKAGNETSSTCSVYDSKGKLTEQTDMLALRQQQTAPISRSLSSARLKTPIQESPLDGGMEMMAMSSPVAPAESSEVFDYDHHGNRYQYTDKNGAVSTFTHNTVNQYDQIDTVPPMINTHEIKYFDHDENGNLSEDGDGFLYNYDYRNRLTAMEDVVSFVYDALGRRIKKVDLVTDKITWYYHNLSGQVIAEYEQTGSAEPALARSFAYGNGISEVLAMFLPEPPCDTADLDEFIDFASHWLCVDPNACYEVQFDANSDDVIDLEDFAEFAAEWSVCSTKESRFYYLHDVLGSVMGIVGGKFDRESDREFYNYEVYGQPLDDSIASAAGNPFRFAGYRYDTESYLYDLRNRTYNPVTGRFLQFDPIGYADSMNLYEYVTSNPISYIDPMGLNLYAIGGTWESYADNYNVRMFHDRCIGDSGRSPFKKYYWNGPGTGDYKLYNAVTGNDSESIINSVTSYICQDYCKNPDIQINLVGWSRGGAIALAVAERLQTIGCYCCGTPLLLGGWGVVNPSVNWVGLFDAVDMSPSMEPRDTSNIGHVDHARKTKVARQPLYPTIDLTQDNVRNQYFYTKKGRSTSHSDIGTGEMSFNWMIKQAIKKGMRFSNEENNNSQ